MKKYKALIERKNDLITRAEEIVNGAETEKRELTDAEAQELAEIKDDVKKIKDALGIMDDIGEDREEVPADDDTRTCGDDDKAREAGEARAFDAYIRGIVNERTDYNLDKSGNGAIIPVTIANKIIAKVYNICPILDKSSKYNVKGKLSIPYYDEDTHAITVDYATEFEELAGSVGSFSTVDLEGFLAGALVLISRSLINNTDFNLVDFIVDRMAYAIKRFVEHELLNGKDTTNKVKGLKAGVTLSVTAGAQNAITADEIIKLHDKIIDDYQQGAIFIMSSATRTALRTLKANTGEYLLNDDISSPFGTKILGKDVYVSDNMPDIAAGATVIYYGDMTGLATKFSEQMEIEVLREKYATQHAIGVVGWIEFDAKVEDAQKIAKLVMASA